MNRSIAFRPARGRICARCGRTRPLRAFAPDPRLQDGLRAWCKTCQVAATRAWRAKNRVAINRRKRAEWRRNRGAINARRRELYAQGQGARTAFERELRRARATRVSRRRANEEGTGGSRT